ncbi:MAG TPA: cytosine permease [Candidatus Rubneribacter avistercoris]|nr:cytosine permease [Candidatus Rubneribacter avistercoris]
MPDQGKTKAAGDQGKYEYAFEAVPDSERKSGWGMFLVLAGYPIAVSNFVTGAAIGYQMTFVNALVSILVGDAFLIFIAVSTGIISFETGLSTSFLSRTVFGRKGSAIFSLLLVMSSITWIGINGDTFAQMVIANFPGCPIPAAVLAAVIILVWSISAMRGYRGLEIVSMIGVPTALVLALVVFVILGVNYGGYGVVLSYKPDPASTMPFSEAAASIVGSWVFGCLITPDVCRFGRSKRDVVAAGVGAFTLGLFCLQIVGVIVAQVARNGDFSAATAAIGLGFVVMACTLVCLCTTQDNNIYGAGLAAQNVLDATKLRGKVTHSQIAFLVTACAAAFAACGALQWLLPIIQFLSVLMAPIPAMMVAERYFVRTSKLRVEVNPTAIACWLLGGVVGQACLSTGFFVSPIISYVSTIVLYVVLSKLFDKRVLAGHLADRPTSEKM